MNRKEVPDMGKKVKKEVKPSEFSFDAYK